MNVFPSLASFLLPPPFPAVIAILIVCGVATLGNEAARWLRGRGATLLERVAGMGLAAGTVASIVHGLAWAGAARVSVLRPIGWALGAAGIAGILGAAKRLPETLRGAGSAWRAASLAARTGVVVSGSVACGLLLSALGPATDADSLDYHLGVPLDWLRHGGAYFRPDWFASRLVGLGEALNLLGLASGTDALGAVFQASGLAVAAVALASLARTVEDRVLAALLVAGCPVVVSLVPVQKPQLFPAAVMTAALALVVRRRRAFDRSTALLVFAGLAFAAASKYSFLLTGAVVGVAALLAARRSGTLAPSAAIGAVVFSLIAAPLHVRNAIFYGDPISPLLERFRAMPDPLVAGFARYLRAEGSPASMRELLLLPARLVAPFRPAAVTGVLGVGALGFLPALRKPGEARLFLAAALAATVLALAFSKLSARFFLEPYLWAGAALVSAGASTGRSAIFRALVLQGLLVAIVSAGAAAALFPGALGASERDRVLSRRANGYAACRWLDRVLPRGSVILAQVRSHALLPKPFVAEDCAEAVPVDGPQFPCQIEEAREHGANALVLRTLPGWPGARERAEGIGERIAGPASFPRATRNPFETSFDYQLSVFRLDPARSSPRVSP